MSNPPAYNVTPAAFENNQAYHQLPPQGYGPPPGTGYAVPQHGHQPVVQVHVPVYDPNVGPCAAGGGHQIHEDFTACGLVCGILFFPLGLICCLTMKDRTCLRCGMKFD